LRVRKKLTSGKKKGRSRNCYCDQEKRKTHTLESNAEEERKGRREKGDKSFNDQPFPGAVVDGEEKWDERGGNSKSVAAER